MSHKDLGLIDTDKPYKKLIIPTQSRHLYRLVDQQTGQVLKAQKLIRDHNDLKVYVGDVVVVELTDFFSFENATTVKAEQEPLYMVDAGDLTCISGLISPTEGINLPEMYVLWEPGLPVQTCLNPNAMAMMPIAGLAGNLPLIGQFLVASSQPTSLAVVGTNIVLTMAANVAAGATVTYTKPASGTAAIQDVAGIQSATMSTVTGSTDSIAPVLEASPVFYNGDAGIHKFILHFNEDLASASNSAPTGFKVEGFSVSVVDSVNPSRSGGASTNWYQSGGSSSFSEKAFAISFNFGFLSQSASIQVKYVDPGAGNLNALKDLAGNHAGNMVLGAWTNDNLSADDSTNFIAGKSVLLVGGMGNDTMTGGLANDTFAWFAGDAGTTTGAVDIVKSFGSNSSSDKLDISKLLTNGYVSGTSTLSQWVTSVTTAQTSPGGVSGSTRIVIDPDSTTGSSAATQTIWLEGVNLTSIDPAVLKTNGVLIA